MDDRLDSYSDIELNMIENNEFEEPQLTDKYINLHNLPQVIEHEGEIYVSEKQKIVKSDHIDVEQIIIDSIGGE